MLLNAISCLFSMDMGIDLGTCNALVYVRGEGIVLNEPTVVAVRKGTNIVLNNGEAVGLVARDMLGKTPGSISAIRPLKDGVISDFEITEAMLGCFIRKVHNKGALVRPRVVIAVPRGITAVERRAGNNMDEAIINHLKRSYNLLVGVTSAENVKIQIGSASPLEQELTMEVAGRDTISGLPRKILITSEEIREALKEPISGIIEAVTRTLEKAEPELAADLIDNGMHLCGGGSLLRGMDTILSNATGLKVKRVDEPLTCVARGTSVYLENLELWKDTMDHDGYGWE